MRPVVIRCSKRCDLREVICVEDRGVQWDVTATAAATVTAAAATAASGERTSADAAPPRKKGGSSRSRISCAGGDGKQAPSEGKGGMSRSSVPVGPEVVGVSAFTLERVLEVLRADDGKLQQELRSYLVAYGRIH